MLRSILLIVAVLSLYTACATAVITRDTKPAPTPQRPSHQIQWPSDQWAGYASV